MMTDGLGLGIDHLADVQLIGSGGFSVVYSARHTLFDRKVAVKVLTNVKSEADKRRFERECQVMGRLSGAPNVVTVFHAAYTSQGQPYLIMELVEGGTLADRVDTQGPFAWHEAVDLLIPTAAALGHAHAEGILHRDIKPENILLDDGVPKLTDFGIAQLRDSTGTASTHIAASWLHAPPETFDNERDERSDLYSLASTAHTVIVGQPPFWRENDESLHPLVNRLLNEPPPELPADLAPPELRAFLLRAMAKNPAERPQTAGEFTEGLAQLRGVSAPNPQETVNARDPELTRHVGGFLAPPPGSGSTPTTFDAPAAGPQATPPATQPSTSTAETVVIAPTPATPAPGSTPVAPHRGQASGTQPPSVQGYAMGSDGSAANSPVEEAGGVGGRPRDVLQAEAWPDTGGRPDTGNYERVVYEEPKRRFGLLGALLLVVLLGGGAAFAWWTTRPDAGGAAADTDVAASETAIEGVPSLVGLTEAEAIEQLEAAGIEIGAITTRPSATADEGIVIEQDPPSGAESGPVDLAVSSGSDGADDDGEGGSDGEGEGGGEQDPLVPDVENMSEAAAIDQLEGLGITVTIGARNDSDSVPEGDVISQSPDPGTRSDSVTLVISEGSPSPVLSVTIDDVTFVPGSPTSFEVGDQLSISIDYTSNHDGPIEIVALPTSGDYDASGSDQLQPGSGTHPQSFTLTSPGTVDEIRVHALDADSGDLLAERSFDVDYSWVAVEPPATPVQLSPLNDAAFDIFPRTTTLSWSAVPNAVTYTVEIQSFDGDWVAFSTPSGLGDTSYQFNFVGAQPGRWRVWAVDANGEASAPSGWWRFEHLQ